MILRITASLLSVLLLPTVFFAQQPKVPPERIDPVTQVVRAAQGTLDAIGGRATLTDSDNLRLIADAYDLARLAPDEYKARYADSPALNAALSSLTTRSQRLRPEDRSLLQAYRSFTRGGVAAQSTALDVNDADPKPIIEAVTAEIDLLSAKYSSAAREGDLHSRLEAEARLNVLYEHLKLATGKRIDLPNDPLSAAGIEHIKRASDALKADQRYLRHLHALGDLPSTAQALNALDQEIGRLDALLNTDQPGQFNRARDALSEHLDSKVWRQLAAGQAKEYSTEHARLRTLWNAKYPILPDAPFLPVKSSNPSTYPRSRDVLEATRAYLRNPTDWARRESPLMATYDRYIAGPDSGGLSYHEWRARQLSDSDLRVVLLDSIAITKQPGFQSDGIGIVPFDPRTATREYYGDQMKSLRAEWERRLTTAPEPPPVAPPSFSKRRGTTSVEDVYKARLVEQRYGSLDRAPKALVDEVRLILDNAQTEEIAQTKTQFDKLMRLQHEAEISPNKLTADQIQNLEASRAALRATIERQAELVEGRARAGVQATPASRRDLDLMLAVLGERPPPTSDNEEPGQSRPRGPGVDPPSGGDTNAPRAKGPKPPPRPPSGGGTGARKSSLLVTDGVLLGRLDQLDHSINAFEASLIGRPPVKSPTDSTGKWTADEKGFWSASSPFDHPESVQFDGAVERRPKALQEWNGFIDPETKKPYDYRTKVRNFSSFDPVGGGIHFGERAQGSPMRTYVLTYDDQKQELRLVGSEQTFTYSLISPEELKALYVYSLSDQNLAISIGWTGAISSPVDRGEQIVLLNESFVDNPVGQNLFTADILPWSLDEHRLPNGAINPIATDFGRLLKSSQSTANTALADVVKGVPPFEANQAQTWASSLARTSGGRQWILSVMLTRLFSRPTLQIARAAFVNEMHQRIQDSERLLADAQKTKSLNSNALEQERKTIEALKGFTNVIDSYLMACERDSLTREQSFLRLLEDELRHETVDTVLVQLWFALKRAENKSYTDEDLTSYALYLVGRNSLAILMDHEVKVSFREGKIQFDADVRYAYATSAVEVDPGAIRTGRALKNKSQIVHWDQLETVVNSHLGELSRLYHPLDRVIEYAKIVAFLRWARANNVMAIDFSTLAKYSVADRSKTPTPDAIRRGL